MSFSSFSAAFPCGRHYFSPHKMAAKNHRLSWHCRFAILLQHQWTTFFIWRKVRFLRLILTVKLSSCDALSQTVYKIRGKTLNTTMCTCLIDECGWKQKWKTKKKTVTPPECTRQGVGGMMQHSMDRVLCLTVNSCWRCLSSSVIRCWSLLNAIWLSVLNQYRPWI